MQPLTSFSVFDASIQHTHLNTYTEASTLGNKNARATLVMQINPHKCAKAHREVYTARELQIKCPTLPGSAYASRPQCTDNGATLQIYSGRSTLFTQKYKTCANIARIGSFAPTSRTLVHKPLTEPYFRDDHSGNRSLGSNFVTSDVTLTPLTPRAKIGI